MEQRKQYRVRVQEGRILQIALLPAKGTSPCAGTIIDVSADGAAVRFPLADCPALALGATVELSVTSDQLKTPLLAHARVRHRIEEKDFRQYGFQFTDREQFERRLSPILNALFNRRRAYRVEPDSEAPVEVAVEAHEGGTSVPGRLVNISAGGLQVRLPVDSDAALVDSDIVKLSFSLPQCPRPFALVGSVRSRFLDGMWVRYGIAFDQGRSGTFERQADGISDYVMRRQREILRRAAS